MNITEEIAALNEIKKNAQNLLVEAEIANTPEDKKIAQSCKVLISSIENRISKLIKICKEIDNSQLAEFAEIPKAIPKRAETHKMPVARIAKVIFNQDKDDKRNAEIYNHDDGHDGANITVGEIGKGKNKKAVTVAVSMRINESIFNVNISKNAILLNPYHRSVYNAMISLHSAGNTEASINLIYQTMTGNRESNSPMKETTRQELENAIKEVISRVITIDARNESEEYGYEEFYYMGQLLPAQFVKRNINGNITDCVLILAEPPLYSYAKRTGQISTNDIKLLDVPLSMTSDTIILRDYLLEQISDMKNPHGKRNDIIRYDTLYKLLNIKENNKTEKKRLRDKVYIILNSWIDSDFIYGYEKDIKEGKTIAKIKIILEEPKKRISAKVK